MHLSRATIAATAIALWATALAAQVSLHDLPALARARAERLRPDQEKKLEPFWTDLALDYYKDNSQFLDGRIAQVAALGDSVVPLLLEKLQPVANNTQSRNLAANCRRVLERLDPAGFLDALVELAASGNDIARIEAIQLLGRSGSARAVPVLARMLAEGRANETQYLLLAMVQLHDPSVAEQMAPMLGSADRSIRSGVLDYLTAAKAVTALPMALQGIAQENDKGLLPKYVEYLGAVAHEHDQAARALLPLLDRERLDWRDTKRLVQVLATVAPRGHDPTVRRLQELLDTGDTGALGLEAALTLRALGDRSGLKKLQSTINDGLKRRRQEPQLYEDRANAYLATGEWKDAADDYEKVLELSNSPTLQRKVRLLLVKCEAHRNRSDRLLKILKDGNLGPDDVASLAQDDPVVQDALQRPSVRAWLQAQSHDKGK
jgi:tetratricopeptide (TPR) repeat protein